jgi:MYXO-CTERM domain-containing protein
MKFKALAAGIALASLFSYSASAVTLNTVYTGATPENTLEYELAGTTLTLRMTGPSATEFISNWGFNINTDPAGVSIGTAQGLAAPTIDIPGAPSLNPLSFLFSLDFQTSAGPGRFQTGDSLTVNLPLGTTILGTGAHVQGINGELSGKVTVPEPSAALAGLLALGFGVALRRRMA